MDGKIFLVRSKNWNMAWNIAWTEVAWKISPVGSQIRIALELARGPKWQEKYLLWEVKQIYRISLEKARGHKWPGNSSSCEVKK